MTTKFLLTLEVSSPDDLRTALSNTLIKYPRQYRFLALAISNPEILVYPFQIKKSSVKDVKRELKAQAVEFLSLPLNQIEMDYQIINSSSDKLSGVLVCASKELFKQYLAVIEKSRLVPVRITARILASIDSFFLEHPSVAGRFCCLEFFKDHVHLAVFNNRQAELIRDIGYENLEEAKLEIVQSLRSASSKSSVKKLDCIYYCGEISKEDIILRDLERMFNTKIQNDNFGKIDVSLCRADNFFSLNLLRGHIFSIDQSKRIYQVINSILGLLLVGNIFLGLKLVHKNTMIRDVKSTYQLSDYTNAQDLERKLKRLQ